MTTKRAEYYSQWLRPLLNVATCRLFNADTLLIGPTPEEVERFAPGFYKGLKSHDHILSVTDDIDLRLLTNDIMKWAETDKRVYLPVIALPPDAQLIEAGIQQLIPQDRELVRLAATSLGPV